MDKMKQWALLTAVAIVAVAVGGWFVLISPQRSKASDLHTQTQAQQQRNQQIQNELASLKEQHKDLPEVQAELAKLGVQLPNNPALPALIRSLSAAADSAGVDLISIAPSTPTALTPAPTAASTTSSSTAGSTATAGTTPAVNVGALEAIPVSLQVNGGYFQVEQFESNLEALGRPFLTQGLTICGQKPLTASGSSPSCIDTSTASGAADYDGHVQATITGQVFMVSGGTAASTATK